MRVNVWVARYRSAAGDEFLLFDNYQGGIAGVVDSAYRLRRVDGQLRLVGRTAVADGAVANVIADQDGNRRVVGTWRFEGERY